MRPKQVTTNPKTDAPIDGRDLANAVLRGSALTAGIVTTLLRLESRRDVALAAFVAFGGFTVFMYAIGLRVLRTQSRSVFYLATALADFAFVGALIHLDGGRSSPFMAGIYVWTALYSHHFGLRGGAATCSLALGLLAGFDLASGTSPEPTVIGFMLLLGPVLGYLFDLERRKPSPERVGQDHGAEARKRMREQARLIEVAKSLSVEVLAGGVAHEINNPLAGILACVKALQDGVVPEGRRADYFDGILDGIARIQSITRALVDYSRRRPAALAEVDVAELVRSTAVVLAQQFDEKGVEFHTSLRPEELRVRSDAGQLRRALLNVILNAVQFAPPGSRVEVSALRDGDDWGIVIADSGPGIAQENLGRVCEPFFTTKPEGEGTGLGLAVTAGLLRAQGGRLSIESTQGRGTTVTMWLPAWRPIGA